MYKYVLLLVGLGLAFALGLFTMRSCNRTASQTTQRDATVLLERIEEVLKLVTVEGNVSEIYNETQTKRVTLYLPLPASFSFDKKATVQVWGKVLVGYDLDKLELELDEEARRLSIRNIPEPEILAIDHEMAYLNLDESWFNSFTAKDYTALNHSAKSFLRQKAAESELMDRARQQGQSVIETIKLLAEGAGLEVVVENPPVAPEPESIFE